MRRVRTIALAVAAVALLVPLVAAPARADAPVPTVQLLRGGVLVDPGSEVRAGAKVTVAVSGFAPDVRVWFTVGTAPLAQSVRTSTAGSGVVDVTIPPTLGSSVYVLAARGGLGSAAFVFYVYNPPAAVTPTPTPTVTATPVPSPSVSPAGPGTGASGGDDLATTGASLVPLAGAAGLALVVGLVLLLAGRRRREGRHSRGPVAEPGGAS